MNILEILNNIQSELNAPKSLHNKFGGYDYRSCETILAAVKPLLQKYKAVLTLSDEVVQIYDRYYVKATATIACVKDREGLDLFSVCAYAREADDKKGMDASKVTGAASSYARKYALNGLLAIDDTKDADTDEQRKEAAGRATAQAAKDAAKAEPVPAPAPVVAKCADCGKDIEGRGKYTPEAIAKKTHKTYGRMLCWECAEKANEARKAAKNGVDENAG